MKFSINKLAELIKREFKCVELAYLFGSSVNGEVRKGSDIDIAVYVDKEYLSLNPTIGLEIEICLQNSFNAPVDVVILNKANSLLNYQVIKTGVRLFEKEPAKRAYLENSIIKEYFDIQYYQTRRNHYGK